MKEAKKVKKPLTAFEENWQQLKEISVATRETVAEILSRIVPIEYKKKIKK